MTTPSQSTVGSTVYLLDITASPPTIIAVPALKGLSGVGGGKVTKIDISNMDSVGYNENAGGRADPPEATGELVLKKSVVGHQKLKALFEAQAKGLIGNLPIYIGDGDSSLPPTVVAGALQPPQSASPKKWTRSGTLGTGYISSLMPKKADNDVDRADFGFQFSGGSTWMNKGDLITLTY